MSDGWRIVADISDSALTRMRARVEPIIARTCHYPSPVTHCLMGFFAPAARKNERGTTATVRRIAAQRIGDTP
jgi:hypothetical protein